ncbi:hypothetical protein AAHB33_05485 [Paenarthrobacter sp. S56]|uniref:hypothetical protein n=1 Tax=Paenarthrobacter sp. S56 TaxID=3138179 RepID=UPI00321A12C2
MFTRRRAAEPGDGWVLATDWTGLKGRTIEVYENGEFVDCGKVETITPDGKLLWLRFQGNFQRRIIEKLPEVSVRVRLDQVQPD